MREALEGSDLPDLYPFLNTELPDGNSLCAWVDSSDWDADEERALRIEIDAILAHEPERFGCTPETCAYLGNLAESVVLVPSWLIRVYGVIAHSYDELQWALIKTLSKLLQEGCISWQPKNSEEFLIRCLSDALVQWSSTRKSQIETEVRRWRTAPPESC
jgi:hypothetical protein